MALTVWRTGVWRLQIVKRSDTAGFEVLLKRWIVERTFAWISRNRRLARDFERYATTCCLRPSRHDPHYAQAPCCKPFVMNPNFPDRLSGAGGLSSISGQCNCFLLGCQLQGSIGGSVEIRIDPVNRDISF